MDDFEQALLYRRNRLEDWFEELDENLYVVPPPGYNEIAPLEELIERRAHILFIYNTLMQSQAFQNILEQATLLNHDPEDQAAINEICILYATNNFADIYVHLTEQMDSLDALVVQLAPTLCGNSIVMANMVLAQTASLECHDWLVQLLDPLDLADTHLLGETRATESV